MSLLPKYYIHDQQFQTLSTFYTILQLCFKSSKHNEQQKFYLFGSINLHENPNTNMNKLCEKATYDTIY